MGANIPETPRPLDGGLIRNWAFNLTQWLNKHARVYAGSGLRETSTPQGRLFAAIEPDPYIGSLKMMAGDMIGSDANKWLLCDGTEYDVEDYPQLYASIGNTWGGTAPSTFKVPPSGFFPVNIGQSPNYSRDGISYAVGDTGGYNLHGKTENNHPDHSFDLDLYHTHDAPVASTEVQSGTGATVGQATATGQTGGPENWGTGDSVPTGGTDDPDQGSIGKTGDVVSVNLKHGGWTTKETNSGDFTDDSDNRPAFAAVKFYIRALP